MVEASKQEALLGVDLYNSPSGHRSLEGFFIHMHMAWLYLLQAMFKCDGVDYRYRRPNGRFEKVDGEPKTWDLRKCMSERWSEDDPIRANLEFTRLLRNKIEHRYEKPFRTATSGYAQALLVNYEKELTARFGVEHSLSGLLRFPVFLGTLTEEAVGDLREVQRQLPQSTQSLMTEYRSGLDPSVTNDERFEFRINLIPMMGPKSEADISLRFVRLDDLTEEQREVLTSIESGKVIIRDHLREVANLGKLTPKQAAAKVEAAIPFRFNTSHLAKAWRVLGIRPSLPCEHPERTDERYCTYDPVHADYVYTEAFVRKLIREASTREGIERLLGWKSRPKPNAAT